MTARVPRVVRWRSICGYGSDSHTGAAVKRAVPARGQCHQRSPSLPQPPCRQQGRHEPIRGSRVSGAPGDHIRANLFLASERVTTGAGSRGSRPDLPKPCPPKANESRPLR